MNTSYLGAGYGLRSWLLSTDHKRVAVLYLVAITVFFFVGGAAATLIRLNLAVPDSTLMTADTYNRAFTLHAVVMVWFFLIPSIPAVFGNFLLPLMIGAQDLAFPRLNLASWWVFMAGGLVALWGLVVGGVDTGWTFYTPFSSTYSNSHVVTVLAGVVIAGFSSILTGINLIVTTHTLRAPGMVWSRLPLFVWAIYATAAILILATPVLALTLVLVAGDRIFALGLFDPRLGGDPLLFQHLFWFYSHPAVYIMVLPAMGVTNELIACFSRRRIFGYRFVAAATLGIASIGFLVWGHHMFVAGMSTYASFVFSLLTFVVAVPSGIKVYNWTATLYKGRVRFDAPMLFGLGFIGLFVVGGVTGLFLASLAFDVHVTDTYFVVAHFHFIMVGGTVSAYMGALHFWWPKITGRMYPEGWGRASAVLIFFGFLLTFLPQYWLGWLGMPRRYWHYPPEFQVLNVLSSAGASILAVGYLLPLAYLLWSAFRGPRAPANPWGAAGLEWTVASPPPRDNFAATPVVDRPAYDYPEEDAHGR
ncbi:MAG: cytochrome c oxidase subunit I [Actinomycetota bacterium]